MEANKILSADLLDLVFDNRNKDYGAYDLRRTYARRIKKAMIMTAFIFIAITVTFFANSTKAKQRAPDEGIVVSIIPIEDKVEPPLPEPEKPKEPERVQTTKLTDLVIVDKEDVVPPPDQEEIKDAKIAEFTQEGIKDDRIPDEKPLDDGKGILDGKKNAEPEGPYVTVEIPAKFIGNWEKFLLKNLNAQTPVDNGAPAGKHRVMIRFVVDKDGSVSDIIPLTNIGFGMEQEAIRVLKKAPKWEPAIQNGYQVKAYHTQVITFEVYEDQ